MTSVTLLILIVIMITDPSMERNQNVMPTPTQDHLQGILDTINSQWSLTSLVARGAAIIHQQRPKTDMWSITYDGTSKDTAPEDSNRLAVRAELQRKQPANAAVSTIEIYTFFNGSDYITRWQCRYVMQDGECPVGAHMV